jgi:hypothetical protein
MVLSVEEQYKLAETAFMLARADAIDRYAQVEHVLANLFILLSRCDEHAGNMVFFRVGASHRASLFADLLELRFGKKYDTFWRGETKSKKGMFALLNKLDADRNAIVHWHTLIDQRGVIRLELRKPAFWTNWDKQVISTREMRDFAQRARFCALLVRRFTQFNTPDFPMPEEWQSTWVKAFESRPVYPPAPNHVCRAELNDIGQFANEVITETHSPRDP